MIGSDLNATPPQAGDTVAVATSRIIDTFSRLIAAVQGTVPVSAINFANQALDLALGSITNASYTTYLPQATQPTAPGTFYNYNGDCYWVSELGSVRMTNGASLDAGSLGGIVGDYGGVDPARVTYIDAESVYEFTTDPGVPADIRCEALQLDNGDGVTTITSSGGGTIDIPDVPGSTSLVTITSAGNLVFSNTTGVSPTFVDATVTGKFKHPNRVAAVTGRALDSYGTSGSSNVYAEGYVALIGTQWVKYLQFNSNQLVWDLPLAQGDRLNSVSLRYYAPAVSSNLRVELVKLNASTGVETSLGFSTPTLTVGTTLGSYTITPTATLLAANECIFARFFVADATALAGIAAVSCTYDSP